jgi:hypothetical protein
MKRGLSRCSVPNSVRTVIVRVSLRRWDRPHRAPQLRSATAAVACAETTDS